MRSLLAKFCFLVVSVVFVSGCSIQKLQPWERGYLARPEMAWDPDALSTSQRSQQYFSKEASSGGATSGGGGCGCN